MSEIQTKTIPVLGGLLDISVDIAGSGEPLMFLHAAGGLQWDPYLEELSQHYTVYAPYFPGTSLGKPNDIDHIEELWDAVLAYDDLINGLGLDSSIRLIGHSFGGMLACELAAFRPSIFSKVILIAPIGLWDEAAPYTVADWTSKGAEEIPLVLFHNTDAAAVKLALTPPDDEDAAAEGLVHFLWTLGCTAKIIWPIPDKGLSKRIHRVVADTLVIWGENDALIPPFYVDSFCDAIPKAEKLMIGNCGHVPPLEQTDILSKHSLTFLAA
jgi:pimeloyl-ACP methyl ester carboxylesterase